MSKPYRLTLAVLLILSVALIGCDENNTDPNTDGDQSSPDNTPDAPDPDSDPDTTDAPTSTHDPASECNIRPSSTYVSSPAVGRGSSGQLDQLYPYDLNVNGSPRWIDFIRSRKVTRIDFTLEWEKSLVGDRFTLLHKGQLLLDSGIVNNPGQLSCSVNTTEPTWTVHAITQDRAGCQGSRTNCWYFYVSVTVYADGDGCDNPTPGLVWVYGCNGGLPRWWQITQEEYDANPSAYNLDPISCAD